jgi:hypothetical protein
MSSGHEFDFDFIVVGSGFGGSVSALRLPMKVLAEVALEGTANFVEALRILLDLAGQQVNVNLQSAGRAFEMKSPIQLMPMADIAGEGVKSFVDAEKALVDS